MQPPMFWRLLLALGLAVGVASHQALGNSGYSPYGYHNHNQHHNQHYNQHHNQHQHESVHYDQQHYYDGQHHADLHAGGHVGGHAGGHIGGHAGGHIGGHAGGHVGGHASGHVGASGSHEHGHSNVHGHGHNHGHHKDHAAGGGGSTIINHIHINDPSGSKKHHDVGHAHLGADLGVAGMYNGGANSHYAAGSHYSANQHHASGQHGYGSGYGHGYGSGATTKRSRLVNLAKKQLASRLAAAYSGHSTGQHQSGYQHQSGAGSAAHGSAGAGFMKAAIRQVARKAAPAVNEMFNKAGAHKTTVQHR